MSREDWGPQFDGNPIGEEVAARMIRYTLACDQGHEFESWFADSDAYDVQAAAGYVSCPQCGSLKIGKTIMAPALSRTSLREREQAPATATTEAAVVPQHPIALPDGVSDEAARHVRNVMRAVRRHVMQNTDDVGAQFPAEARRIQAGDVEPRAIRGEASLEDVKALLEEGVGILPIPSLPDDLN